MMFALMKKFRQLMQNDRRGVTALEYGLIAAIMAGILVTVIGTFGSDLTTAFTNIGTKLTTAGSATGS
jgi:pilus assembly protein Flp/PilA